MRTHACSAQAPPYPRPVANPLGSGIDGGTRDLCAGLPAAVTRRSPHILRTGRLGRLGSCMQCMELGVELSLCRTVDTLTIMMNTLQAEVVVAT